MKRLAAIFLLAASPALTAPYGPQEAQNAVKAGLRDPSSAQFRNVKIYQGGVCGEVNAKNLYGGYVGFRKFVFDRQTKAVLMKEPPQEGYDPLAGMNDALIASAEARLCK